MDAVWIVLISIAGFLLLMYVPIILKWLVWAFVWLTEGLACVLAVVFFPITLYCRLSKKRKRDKE